MAARSSPNGGDPCPRAASFVRWGAAPRPSSLGHDLSRNLASMGGAAFAHVNDSQSAMAPLAAQFKKGFAPPLQRLVGSVGQKPRFNSATSLVRWRNSPSSRAFSIAMTACAAKFCSSRSAYRRTG